MSRRSLQRALTADGTTFQKLLADVRLAVATGHLRDGRTVGEIAFLLGFSEPSAFRRAFRRWTGDSPRAFRARASS
jgi:AraC-like DNA-binding protein